MYLKEANGKHLSSDELRDKFYSSVRGREIIEGVEAPVGDGGDKVREIAEKKFANSWSRSMKLLARRELLLWWRDKYQIKAKLAQGTSWRMTKACFNFLCLATKSFCLSLSSALIMGTVVGKLRLESFALLPAVCSTCPHTFNCYLHIVGTLFWQSDDNPNGLVSVLFQSMFIGVVGAMLLVVKQFPLRSIFYKQQDANFYPTWTYVVGRSIATIPSALIDSLLYGTIVFFFAGLAINDGASGANYIVFILSLFVLALTAGLFFSMYSAAVENIHIAQAAMAVSTIVLMLFSGFTVQPDVIPD
jgi:hypothetical protein